LSLLASPSLPRYNSDEARNLKTYGELPESAKINETVTFGEDQAEDEVVFDDADDDDMMDDL